MDKLSLFTGIGGDDLASEWAGITTVCMVEKDKYCQKILKKNFPGIPIIEDVRDVTKETLANAIGNGTQRDKPEYRKRIGIEQGSEVVSDSRCLCGKQRRSADTRKKESRRALSNTSGFINIISGGFPCQPHSVAGKRKGSDDERNLWPEFRRIIGEIKPRWVVGENVPGIFSSDAGRFFGEVVRDLAEMGYSVGWCTFGAVDVGALHRRNRVFIVGHSKRDGCSDRYKETRGQITGSEQGGMCESERTGIMADSPGIGIQGSRTAGIQESEIYVGKELPFGSSPGEGTSYWQSEPNVGRVANGVPHRVDRLRGLGNAVVPQQAYEIYRGIMEIETQQMM